ncbi:AraC family transcriptional regulator [Paenibacillus sp. ACRRX]|uniref:AraC family transcriptional regulator n=1 Tax=Paenibacillus sp. ACRRX TaxID=2918206 RepID=UPI001EF5927E|nr:AraC family transcriptional regulator [Paenibacillus sp. ACRRX]MCG7406612.1 AraC family transcriptional regulator [Paenibacillus sp. ACRRX]
MKQQEEYKVWNQLHIELADIRLHTLAAGEAVNDYHLPASAFLFLYRGKAKIRMDGLIHPAEHFYCLHGGKGMRLDIEAKEYLEYYLVLYRGEFSLRRRYFLSKGEIPPYQQIFSFAPAQPVGLYQILHRMEEAWSESTEKDKFVVKTLFYQFILEMLQQKQQSGVDLLPTEVVKQVVQYMHKHVDEPLTLELLGQRFGYNPQYLARRFKELTTRSPIDYLIGIRIGKACHMLQYTDASISDISQSVGYEDVFYFNRIFKKNVGLSPSHFRKKLCDEEDVRFNPDIRWGLSISESTSRCYIDNDNYYRYNKRGEYSMYRTSRKNIMATLLLCMALLVTACGGGAPSETSAPVSNSSEQTQKATPVPATKIVNTMFGEVEISKTPERIVAIQYLSSLLAVKANAIASTTRIMDNPYFRGLTDNIEIVGSSGNDVSFEKLIDLNPDLIVVMTSDEEEYKKYNKIAPTVAIPYGYFSSIEEEVKFFGDLLGREEEAIAWIADYTARIAAAHAKVQAVIPSDATFSIMQESDKTLSIYGSEFGRGGKVIYENLGRKSPPSYNEAFATEKYKDISMELLDQYAGDYIILTTEKSLEELRKDSIWGKLEAVKNDRLYAWSNNRSYFIDPLSVLMQTEELAEWLTNVSQKN